MNLKHFAAACLLFSATSAAQGQTLRIAINNDPDILDPTLSRTFVGTSVMSALCDKLFDFDQSLAIVPRLATSYEWADPVTLIPHLRPGVTFHDGTPFDAAAVNFNLDRHVSLPGSFRAMDTAARRALYGRVWQQQAADLAIIYLYTPRYIMGARKQVQGYRVLPDGLIRLQGVSLQP